MRTSRILSFFFALSCIVFQLLADEPIEVLKTQFVAPVSNPVWAGRVATGPSRTGAGIAYNVANIPNVGVNYTLNIGGVVYYALSACVSGPNLTFPPVWTRSCLSDNSPSKRYLYPASYIVNKKYNFAFGGEFSNVALENQVIANSLDSSAEGADFVQCVHVENKYRITFKPNGGIGSDKKQDYIESGVLEPNTYTRTGYVFSGWNTSANGSGERFSDGQSIERRCTTLYAQWVPEKRIVNAFDGSGGMGHVSPDGERTYDYGSVCTLTATPNDGYHFLHWTIGASASVLVNPYSFTVVDNVNIKASFAPNTYTIKFVGNGGGGTAPPDIHAQYDAAVELPVNTFQNAGYEFKGWSLDREGNGRLYDVGRQERLNLASDDGAMVVLYAVWRPIRYMLVLHRNDGSGSVQEGGAVYGEKLDSLTPPRRNGYVFMGYWNAAFDTCYIDENGVGVVAWNENNGGELYAKWVPNTYSVRFEPGSDGVFGEMPVQVFVYDEAQSLERNCYEKIGHIFCGWSEVRGGGVEYQDCESVSNLTVVANGMKTLFAVWERNVQTVIFDALEGRIAENGEHRLTVDDQYVPGMRYEVLPVATNAAPDRIFAGWWTSTNFSEAVQCTPDTLADAAVTNLYARWKTHVARQECELVFSAPDAGINQTVIVGKGMEIGATMPAAPVHTNDAYAFFGWFDPEGKRVTASTVVLSDHVFVARWTLKEFNEGFGCWDLAFSTDATAGVGVWSMGADGVAKSGAMLNVNSLQVSRLQVWTYAAGMLAFERRVSCYPYSYEPFTAFSFADRILSLVDVEDLGDWISGKREDWESVTCALATGGVATWRYYREERAAPGTEDAGFVRNLVWIPSPVVTGIDGWQSISAVKDVVPSAQFAVGGAGEWSLTEDVAVVRAESVADGCSDWVSLTVGGPGILTFDWRVSCEAGYVDTNGVYRLCDHLGLYVDGREEPVLFVDGCKNDEFATVVYTNMLSGVHTYKWRYVKDVSGAAGEDMAELRAVSWQPLAVENESVMISYADAMGQQREVSVPKTWVDEYGLLPNGGTDDEYEAALKAPSGKFTASGEPLCRWHDYVAGTDPTDVNDLFRITAIEVVDGMVSLSWSPDLRNADPPREYQVLGKESLIFGDWAPTNSASRFFRVDVHIKTP